MKRGKQRARNGYGHSAYINGTTLHGKVTEEEDGGGGKATATGELMSCIESVLSHFHSRVTEITNCTHPNLAVKSQRDKLKNCLRQSLKDSTV